MQREIYRPYFEAVKKILDGESVKNLEDVRNGCNSKWMKDNLHEDIRSCPPELIVATFAADAENKILMGTDPIDAYTTCGGHGMNPVELRDRSKSVLWNVIRYL